MLPRKVFIVLGRTRFVVLIALAVLILPVVGNGDGTGTGAGSGTGAPQNTADNAIDFSQFFSESEQEMLETNEELDTVKANLLLAIQECSAKEEERLQMWQTLEQKRVVMEQRQEVLDQRTTERVEKEGVRDDKQTDLDGKQAALDACEDCSCGQDEPDCSCPDCSGERSARDNAQTELDTAQTELDDAIVVETTAQENLDTAETEHTTAETEFGESAECADGACLVQGDLEGVDLRQGGCSDGPCVSFSTDDSTITQDVESQVGEDPMATETTTDAEVEEAFDDMEGAFADMDAPGATITDFDAAAGDFLIDGANRLEDLITYTETMAEAYDRLETAMAEDNEELTAYLEGKDPMGLTPAELEDLFTFVIETKDQLPVDDDHFFDAMHYLSSEEGELFLADIEEKSLAGTITNLNMDKENIENVIDALQSEKEFYEMLLFWAADPEDIAWVLEEIALIEEFQDALRDEVTRIDSEMVELNKQREKVEAEKTALQENLEAAEAKVTTAKDALNKCSGDTNPCDETTVAALQQDLQLAEEEVGLLQTQLEETNTLLEELDAKGGELEEEKENIETTVNTFDNIIGGGEVDPDALNTLVDITKNKATETVDTIDEQIDVKKDEQGQITITIDQNQGELENKQAQTEKERQELALRQLEEAQNKEQELKQTKTKLSTDLIAAEDKLAYIEEQLKAATEEDKKTLEELKQQVLKEREELEAKLGEIATQIDDARDHRHELEDKYGVGNPEQRAAENQIDEAKAQETQLEEDRAQLTTDIKEKDEVLTTIEEQLKGASTDEERKQLEEQKAIVLNERDQLSTQLEDVKQDIEQAATQRQELEEEYEEQYGAPPPEPKAEEKDEEKPETVEEATNAFESVIENIEQAGVEVEGEEAVTEAPPNANPNVEFLNAVTETLERVAQSAAKEERDEGEPEPPEPEPKKEKKKPEPVIIPPPVASYIDPFPTQYSPIGIMSIIEEPLVAVEAAPPPSRPSTTAPVTPAGPSQPSQAGEIVTAPPQLDPVDAANLAAVFVDGEQLETPDGATILVDSTTNEVYKVTQEGVETTGTDQLHIQERVDPLTGDTEYYAVVGNVTDENSTLSDIAEGNATDIAEGAIIEIRYLDDAKNVLFIGPRCQMTNLTDVEVRVVILNDTVINATKNETNATVMLLDISCVPAVTVDKDDPEANVVTFLEEMECFGAEVGRCLDIELYMVVIGKDENLWEVQCIEKLYSGIE